MILRVARLFFLALFMLSSMQLSAQDVANLDLQTDEPLETFIWELRPGMITYYQKRYSNRRLCERILQRSAQAAIAGAIGYSTWWAGSSIYRYFKKEPDINVAAAAADLTKLAEKVAILEKSVQEESWIIGGLKLIGTLVIQGVVLAAANKVYTYAMQDLYENYLKEMKKHSGAMFEFIEFSIERMTSFQAQNEQIFRNHHEIVKTYVQRVFIPFCEEYLGLYQSLLFAMPRDAIEYKLNSVPAYLTTLVNKSLYEINQSLQTLEHDPLNTAAVHTIKHLFELLHNEINTSLTRALLVVEQD